MSFIHGAVGIVMGIIILMFGALMYSVGGYGVMEPIYSGIMWLGLFVMVASPIIYWVWPLLRRARDNA